MKDILTTNFGPIQIDLVGGVFKGNNGKGGHGVLMKNVVNANLVTAYVGGITATRSVSEFFGELVVDISVAVQNATFKCAAVKPDDKFFIHAKTPLCFYIL